MKVTILKKDKILSRLIAISHNEEIMAFVLIKKYIFINSKLYR